MKRLFLASLFSGVAKLLPGFAGDSLVGKKVAFIPTAARHESVTFYVADGKKALEKLGLIVTEIDVSTATPSAIAEMIPSCDIIYISGGNTFFLLQELKKSGADKMIIEHIQSGKIYIGESAGSVIMAPNIEYVKELDDINEAPELKSYDSLSITDFYPVPHYKNFPFTKNVAKILKDNEAVLPLLPFSNSQVIFVTGDTYEVVKK